MIFSYSVLYQAWIKESKGKKHMPNQERYRYYLEENLYTLSKRLNDGDFKPHTLRIKNIYYPKRRKAQVPSQVDKIVQHAICDEVIYYPMVKPLIDSASANTRGRGTDYGVKRLQRDLRKFYLKHHRVPYILKGDVKDFFGSIPIKEAERLVYKYIHDKEIQEILIKFIELTDLGLPLGLQQSQLLANLLLSGFDHKIKEEWRMKYYGRHMDDFYILCEDKKTLENILAWSETYLDNIRLKLNPKTSITYRSFDYLGFHFIVSDSGKIITRLSKNKLKSKRRHLKKLVKQLAENKITTDRFEVAYFGWRQHACKAKNARNQILNMDKYVNELLNKIGYHLTIKKYPRGKVRWRVAVTQKGENNE